VSEAAAPVLGAVARQGRALRGRLREEGSRVEANGNSAPVWQLHGNNDMAHTCRRRLHGLHVERTWRAADRAGARWRAVTKPPWHHHTHVGARWLGHAAMGRHGPLASGPCHFSDFLKIFHLPNFEIQNSDLLNVKIQKLLYRDIWKHKEQLSFLEQLQIPKGLHVINSGINSNLNFP
jgi:hypothetical protein